MTISTLLSSEFLADIQPALDDARRDPDDGLHKVSVAVANPAHRHYANGHPHPYAITVDLDEPSVRALIDEARWRYRAWEGSPDRCIAEHYRRFCQSIGIQPQSL